MEPGKRYLIMAVDWYVFCGRMIRQVAPYEYEFELVSTFDTNAGNVFGQVAADEGNYRAGCTFQHYPTKAILGLGRVAVFEWVGKLPQET